MRPVSQKQFGLMSFFQDFHEKPPAVKPIFGQKNVNPLKITLYYGPKSQQDVLFSQFFTKSNCSHAHVEKKKLPISKKHDALIPIFYQPNIHDLKTTVLLYYFISNFYEKPPAVIPIFGQKTSFLS